jgi:hypothetical protein
MICIRGIYLLFIGILLFIIAISTGINADILKTSCSRTLMTSAEFSKAIFNVALNGHFEDIHFLEQSFHTNFLRHFAEEGGGKMNTNRILYHSDNAFGESITVDIDTDKNVNEEINRGFITIIRFDLRGALSCFRVIPSDIYTLFTNGKMSFSEGNYPFDTTNHIR